MQRQYSLDIIRILACLLVVLMHSPMPTSEKNGPFLAALSYFTEPCIGLFFMVSGTLLLPVKSDFLTFIRKRFNKIIVPTVLWSLIYIGLKLYNNTPTINLWQSLASIPFSNQEGVLWFMYTLAGLYLVAPILSAWLEKASKKEIEIILWLWCISLCYPIFDILLITNNSPSGVLYYFTGYLGYFVLGYYLKRYPQSISLLSVWLIALFGVVSLAILKYRHISVDFPRLFGYLSIFIAALTIAIWKTINSLFKMVSSDIVVPMGKNVLLKLCSELSNVTFGVYLVHFLILREFIWRWGWIASITNYPLQCLTIATLTILLSITICLILSRVPKSEWLIGYHHR